MNTINCGTCGGTAIESRTVETTKINACTIIINDVPCYVCNACDEIIFNSNLLKEVDKMIELLKSELESIIYADYSKCMLSNSVRTA